MFQDGSIELFQYWNHLRRGRPAPHRTEIAPGQIKTLLPDTFILERDELGSVLFRLAGTRMCSTYGRELKGHSFTALWSEKDRQAIARLVRRALADKSVLFITFEGLGRDDRRNAFELLILPVEGGDDHPRALGTVQPIQKPFWLGAEPILENALESFRVIDPDREPLLLSSRKALTVPSLLPDSEALTETLAGVNGRRIRHLVVFDGGRRR
ncbi:PAS domain-containing protein [Chelativorans sp. AA-79]|uniref:PAS domain-containing protein n=1 Tax=Chelativorans sp. AA-79 TaxID=3028735 RepID=UPI0023F80B93|nr:PAS domain-containing protein [Chelativorans sp. AA-79]WEX07069.1 PAS domain-containing protein [Chelativorans sp. AA-79]